MFQQVTEYVAEESIGTSRIKGFSIAPTYAVDANLPLVYSYSVFQNVGRETKTHETIPVVIGDTNEVNLLYQILEGRPPQHRRVCNCFHIHEGV